MLSPAFKFYQVVLFPVARPTAWILDMWLGPEGNDLNVFEGKGAINFLALDSRY